jgi:hypothetical protein
VINPRAGDDTPVGRSGANRDQNFVMGELLALLNQRVTAKSQSKTFELLKGCSRQDIGF